jgi:hypothetical protein
MRESYFHEDDYCQIEILPVNNLKFCLEQAGKISEFSEKHQNGIGWDAMYVREDNPKKLSELGITLQKLRDALSEILPEYDEVYTGYSTSRVQCTNTYAFGQDNGETIFVEVNKSRIITSLWVSDPMPELLSLPKHERLLLADWGWEFICPLSNKIELENYLIERTKAFAEIISQWNAEKKQNKKWWKFW